jgi:hypothetical protein
MTTEFPQNMKGQEQKQAGNLGQKEAEKQKQREADLSKVGEKTQEAGKQQQR